MSEIQEILEFWFAEPNRPRWFKASIDFDGELRRRFGSVATEAASGRRSEWQAKPESALALVLCLDQFPRNLYRGTPRMYAADALARDVARAAVERGFDGEFHNEDEQIFFYLPFEHSEDIADQNRAVELFRERTSNPEYLRHAIAHRDVIARFGRFPHRNAILGRRSAPDEEDYLKQPGAGF